MDPIRVLIVDDSAVVRRMMAKALDHDQIEVVGSAPNGVVALEKIERLEPDVVTLDLEMPVMGGLEVLDALREQGSRVRVVVVSSLTTQGAGATIEALSRGAQDYVTKPSGGSSVDESIRELKENLCPRLLALRTDEGAGDNLAGSAETDGLTDGLKGGEESAPEEHAPGRLLDGGPIDVVTIGSSTGGPNALDVVISGLPIDLSVPIVIVQHMPPVFTTQLAKRLDRNAKLRVVEGEDGMLVEPGVVYIAPGGLHMVVNKSKSDVWIETNEEPPENSCRPAVDPLFRSVAEVYGGSALGVVLTGMGSDGLKGAEDLARVGARIIVQDEPSSVVWGMPGFVSRAGLATVELPLDEIAGAITNAVRVGN